MGLFSRKKKKTSLTPPPVPPFQQQPTFPHDAREAPSARRQLEFPDMDEHPQEFTREAYHTSADRLARPAPVQPKSETGLLDRRPPTQKIEPWEEMPKRQPSFMKPRYPQREALIDAPEKTSSFDDHSDDPAVEALRSRRAQGGEHHEPVPTVRVQDTPPATHMAAQKESLQDMQQSVSEDKPIFVKIGQYREAQTTIQLLKQKVQDIEKLLGELESLRNKEQTEIEQAKTNLNQVKEKLLSIDKNLFEA